MQTLNSLSYWLGGSRNVWIFVKPWPLVKAEIGLTALMVCGELNLPEPRLDEFSSLLIKRRCMFSLSWVGVLELNQVFPK